MSVLNSSCEDEIPIPPKTVTSNTLGNDVAVWRSDRLGLLKIAKEPDSIGFSSSIDSDVLIQVDPSIEYQEMEGFGASLTGSSAFVIRNHLTELQQDELLKDLFHPEQGIGLSFIRLTVGASDFSLSDFTYNDLAAGDEDLEQEGFDLSIEDEHLVPVLQKILQINPNLKIMASPWSAPAWMKDNGSLDNGGRLLEAYYDSYALYFLKYVQAMKDRGIPIHSLTVQNEPLYAAPYISLEMSAAEQKIFIRDHLGPLFKANDINVKIILYDHNWDRPDYPLEILDDPVLLNYVAGTAFHCYAGDVSAMSQVYMSHPDLGIYFTEYSGGDFSPNYANNLSWNTENLLVGATRNWSKTVLFWNLALDENHGPKNGGCADCRAVVTVNASSSEVTKNEEYVLLGHLSKFVKYGARRIESNNTRNQDISQVAFKNLN